MLEEVIQIINKEGIVVFPTDTLYGLLGDATSCQAVSKILKIKKRKTGKPMPVFVRDLKMTKQIAEVGKKQERFLRKVWPGKVTVVLKARKNCNLCKNVLGKEGTIGLRMPDYYLINSLLVKIKKPLVGTSANISGKPALNNVDGIIKQLEKNLPDLVFDIGELEKSKASTVIDLTGSVPKILRKGDVSKKWKLLFSNK